MIPALIVGRGGSTGLPGKNIMPMIGRPLMSYPLMAAQNSKYCDRIFLSTDDDEIRKVGDEFGVDHIQRPDYLATNEALAEDAYIHGHHEINKVIGTDHEMLILLFCNGATVLSQQIDEAVEALRNDSSLDSACTVSSYNMWSPLRAKKIDNQGRLVPFIPPEFFGDEVSCDRGSQGDTWYADCSMFVVRTYCMDKKNGDPPFTWLGRNVYPIKQWGGLDVDYDWQVPIVEYWLRKHGFNEDKTPYTG
ncbi:MAG: cytidylyltransferase [Gammaproteobacteria bacterium]|nr:cytidylyltransferase [Gammaproteobacteria bacterium]